jgi:hypothetical protein
VFTKVSSVNPWKYQPVSRDVARVVADDGVLVVTGNPGNNFMNPSPDTVKQAGLKLVGSRPALESELWGVMRRTNGSDTTNFEMYATKIYKRVGG